MVSDHWSNDAMVSMDRCGLFPSLLTSPGLGICGFETKWTSPSARLSTIVAAMRGQSGALLVERMHDAMVEAKEAKHGR